jgi:hypothetical protein
MTGVEAVIDKDRTAALLALGLDADALLLLTDVPAVFRHYGSKDQTAIGDATPDALEDLELAPGSMGPKGRRCHRLCAGQRQTRRYRPADGRPRDSRRPCWNAHPAGEGETPPNRHLKPRSVRIRRRRPTCVSVAR